MPPSFRAAPVQVRVPASSANLGPGFDSLGLALGLHDVVGVRVRDSGLSIDIAGEGADADGPGGVARTEKNLVVQALRATFDLLGGQPRGLEVVCANRIPHGRGLGSSAAAIVAGVCAARALVLGGLPDEDALRLAAELEGHPDNVAACLLGGATLAWNDAGTDGRPAGARALALPVAEGLVPVVFVPESATQSTRTARSLLPDEVGHGVAARTAARAALLVQALAGRHDLLLCSTDDELHQPFRLGAQPAGAELIATLRAAGVAAVLSGSGPTVLALTRSPAAAAAVAPLALPGMPATILALDLTGATVLPDPR